MIEIHIDDAACVHVHLDSTPERVTQQLEDILTRLGAIKRQERIEMATVQDIKDKISTLEAAVARETTVDASVLTLLTELTALVAAIKLQLAEAIASGDPAALQAVVDSLATVETTANANAQALADAVVAHTPAAA